MHIVVASRALAGSTNIGTGRWRSRGMLVDLVDGDGPAIMSGHAHTVEPAMILLRLLCASMIKVLLAPQGPLPLMYAEKQPTSARYNGQQLYMGEK